MKYLTSILLLIALPVFADVAVIINPDNPAQLNEKQVRSIFLSKTKFFPNGEQVRVYSLTGELEATEVFNQKVLRKSQNSLNSYWARMLFSSKGYPPFELNGNETMRQQVANNKAAIGYIDSKFVDGSVKVLFIVKPN